MLNTLRLLLLSILLATASESQAYLMYTNGRIDHVLYEEHAPKVVVAGKIVKVDRAEPDSGLISFSPTECWIEFETDWIIYGSPKQSLSTVRMNITSFLWPQELVKLESGQDCILILRPQTDTTYSIATVVPRFSDHFGRYYMATYAKRILEREILEVLKIEQNPRRQVELLKQVGPILTDKNLTTVASFANSTNEWVRFSAVADLCYATEDEKYLQMAAKDVQNFFSKYTESDLINGYTNAPSYAPYPFFYQHYFWLESATRTWGTRWDDAEADKNTRMLKNLLSYGIIDKTAEKRLLAR